MLIQCDTSSGSGRIRLTKVQATGNDFLLLCDADGIAPLPAAAVAALCARRLGVGADGIIRAVHSAHITEGAAILHQDPAAKWFMDYVNADGSRAEMCGNGVRAFVRYLVYAGLASLPVGGGIAVGTRAGVRHVHRTCGGFTIDMGLWRVTGRHVVRADGIAQREGVGINLGNPHVVVAVGADELEALRLERTPVLEPPARDGANVEFVVIECSEGRGRVRMRVSERGVGETQSCGTGSVAAALAARKWAGGTLNIWEVCMPGGSVEVAMTGADEERVTLTGPAEVVFDGEFTLPHV
ncbi:hypothetical protein CspeluHIS016_0111540 [Cutaneotrichosporon spelunceum]|uniref:diaminopimelate epimerase n=1 Tax=Cutaneotrichosporon spelunceum TaxID=1672016 RepID=A0AAD3TPE7_9TREE|nr:hypothetical protein CspeluHIS016_0111540 [Cutaneotrichosporon spelunceum]